MALLYRGFSLATQFARPLLYSKFEPRMRPQWRRGTWCARCDKQKSVSPLCMHIVTVNFAPFKLNAPEGSCKCGIGCTPHIKPAVVIAMRRALELIKAGGPEATSSQ